MIGWEFGDYDKSSMNALKNDALKKQLEKDKSELKKQQEKDELELKKQQEKDNEKNIYTTDNSAIKKILDDKIKSRYSKIDQPSIYK